MSAYQFGPIPHPLYGGSVASIIVGSTWRKIGVIEDAMEKTHFSPPLTPALLAGAASPVAAPRSEEEAAWPQGGSRGRKSACASRNISSPPRTGTARPRPTTPIIYPEVCTWYGALTFAQLTSNQDLTAQLIKRFEPVFGTEAGMIPRAISVDNTIFGAIPLELYMETKEQRYLDLGKAFPTNNGRPGGERACRGSGRVGWPRA